MELMLPQANAPAVVFRSRARKPARIMPRAPMTGCQTTPRQDGGQLRASARARLRRPVRLSAGVAMALPFPILTALDRARPARAQSRIIPAVPTHVDLSPTPVLGQAAARPTRAEPSRMLVAVLMERMFRPVNARAAAYL